MKRSKETNKASIIDSKELEIYELQTKIQNNPLKDV